MEPFPEAVRGVPLFLFAFDTPSNFSNLLPVYQEACRRNQSVNCLGGEAFSRKLSSSGAFIGFWDLLKRVSFNEKVLAIWEARSTLSKLLIASKKYPEWYNILTSHRFSILTELALAKSMSIALNNLYRNWSPSYLISTTDLWPFEHVAFREANSASIPTYVIQHGVPNRIWWPFVAKKLLVWGERFKQIFLEFGVPSDRLEVCGMPSVDRLVRNKESRTLSRGGLTPLSCLILSQAHNYKSRPQLYSKFSRFLESVIALAQNTRWTIRLHPSEDGSFYRERCAGFASSLYFEPGSKELSQSLAEADVVCTLFSTAGLEAMLLEKPLVVFNLDSIVEEYAWWPVFGGGVYIASAQDMYNYLAEASKTPSFLEQRIAEQNKFIESAFAKLGRSAEAILTLVDTRNDIYQASG